MKYLSLLIVCLLVVTGTARATTIPEVTSPGGIKAWLVEDHKLPLIAVQFALRGGVEQDPADKQGVSFLTMNLLTQGAGSYDAAAFQQELADHSIGMGFDANRDALVGNLKTLSSEKDKAFELLHLALTQPRFDAFDIERIRSQQLTALRQQLGNPGWQGRYALFQYIFGDHPYGRRRLGSSETLASITQDDIRRFATQHLAQDNLVIAVAGDINPADLAIVLDKVFGSLPKEATLSPITDILWPAKPARILVPREGTQTDMLFVLPGPKRDNADWYAVEIANYILGGGGFSSRLMQEVRDKNGLTYGIDTGLSPMEHGGLIVGKAATDNPKTAKAFQITLQTMQQFFEQGATEKEVQDAKNFLTGALPLALTSTDKIASALVSLQLDRLGRDYFDRHSDYLRAITPDDVNKAIRRWYDPAGLSLSMVGKPDGVEPTLTRDLVRD